MSNRTNIFKKEPLNQCSMEQYFGLDTKSPEKIRQIQDRLLVAHIQSTVKNSGFYKTYFHKEGVDFKTIQSSKDLVRLPLTDKNHLLAHNADFLASPEESITDVCLTSATTGDRPTSVFLTSSDLNRLAYNEAAAFAMLGIRSTDTIFVCAALDRCFMAGLAYYLGGLKIGAKMVRAGSGSAAQHWHMIESTQSTILVGVPSLMRKIGEYAVANGKDPSCAGVQKIIAIGEPVRDHNFALLPAADIVEKIWNAPLYSTYASTEMATAFCECLAKQGGHERPELIVTEILDDSGVPLPAGEPGEVVVTPLGVTGMPLIRFKTGDISFIRNEPCTCGRNSLRLAPVLGRKNHMLKLKGTTVFPSFILSIVEGMKGIAGAYIEVFDHINGSDRVILKVAVDTPTLSTEKITEEIRAKARVVPEISLITQQEWAEKTEIPGKRKRITFFDLRK